MKWVLLEVCDGKKQKTEWDTPLHVGLLYCMCEFMCRNRIKLNVPSKQYACARTHKPWDERIQENFECTFIIFLSKMFLHIFHTRRSKFIRVLVKCCTKEILGTHRLGKIRENIYQTPLLECFRGDVARYCHFGHPLRSSFSNIYCSVLTTVHNFPFFLLCSSHFQFNVQFFQNYIALCYSWNKSEINYAELTEYLY